MGFFNIYSVAKLLKKHRRGDPLGGVFFSRTKVSMPKKLKGGPFSLARYCMLRGKKEKPFRFSSVSQHVQFGALLKFCITFGRTILVTLGVLKKLL